MDMEKIKKIVIDKLSKQYEREEAIKQVNEATIKVSENIVTVNYGLGVVDKLNVVTIKTLAWENETIDSL